jgi:hypothetical protein
MGKKAIVMVDATSGKTTLKLEIEYDSFNEYVYDWHQECLEDRLCQFGAIKDKQVLIEGEVIDV